MSEELIPQGRGDSQSHKTSQTHSKTHIHTAHTNTQSLNTQTRTHRGQTPLNKLWRTKANGDKALHPTCHPLV